MSKAYVCGFFFAVLAAHGNAESQVIHVDSGAIGAGDGSTWCDAYIHLQDALSDVSAGDVIRVAKGSYWPDRGERYALGDRSSTFELAAAVTLEGGYAGCGAVDPDTRDVVRYETILDGDLLGNDAADFENRSDNSYHVVKIATAGSDSIVDGITIRGGEADTSPIDNRGAGVHGRATLRQCVIRDNRASFQGGGVYWVGEGHGIVENCSLIGNDATYGGGLYANDGQSTVLSSLIAHNRASTSGGGLRLGSGTHTVRGCIIENNNATDAGGIFAADASVIDNCIVHQNEASWFSGQGGGIWASGLTIIKNSIVDHNSADRGGGVVCVGTLSDISIINCSIVENSTPDLGGGLYSATSNILLHNSIVWSNTMPEIHITGSSDLILRHCNIPGGQESVSGFTIAWAGGNIAVDPLFADARNHDYHLAPQSLCIDGGDPLYLPKAEDTDLDGHARINGLVADIGADEAIEYVDCNRNRLADSGEVLLHLVPDCNGNMVPDDCDVDCNGDGHPDTCELAGEFVVTSPELSPLDSDVTHVYELHAPPPATGPVNIAVSALGDLNGVSKYVEVTINGDLAGQLFVQGSTCANQVTTESVVLPAAHYNLLLDDGPLSIALNPSTNVGFSECPWSFLTVDIFYDVEVTTADCNSNSTPDACDIASGKAIDCDDNGTIDSCEIAPCTAYWETGAFLTPGIDGRVNALATYDDGQGTALYAGGEFTAAGGLPALNIAKWDGHNWSPVGAGLAGSGSGFGPVHALGVFDDGNGPGLYAGGWFDHAGATQVEHVARWDGQSWLPLGTGVMASGATPVTSFAVFDDGGGEDLYVAGFFSSAGGVNNTSRIARWDGVSWSTVGNGSTNNIIHALTIHSGSIYAGGTFGTIGGQSATRLARWSGGQWQEVAGGAPQPVTALASHGNALVVGGGFEEIEGITVNYVAEWNGVRWSNLGRGLPSTPTVLAVLGEHSTLYAGGYFGIRRYNGGVWEDFAGGPNGTQSEVAAIGLFNAGQGAELAMGGEFSTVDESFRRAENIATLRNGEWHAVGGGLTQIDGACSSCQSEVAVVEFFDDGAGPQLYAGGRFVAYGQGRAENLARWDGDHWWPLPGGQPLTGGVNAMQVFNDGQGPGLYVGGLFGIGRWDGTSWTYFTDGPGVQDLTVFDDGSGPALYAAGSFINAEGVPAKYVAKWDGEEWIGLGTDFLGCCIGARAIGQLGTAGLFLGGHFSPGHIVGWDGVAWYELDGGVSAGSGILEVLAIAQLSVAGESSLYVGGSFEQAGEVFADNIARWDGDSWHALGTGLDGSVKSLAERRSRSGTTIIAAGLFPERIAAWDGTRWRGLGAGFDDQVLDVTVMDNGSQAQLYAAGKFTMIDGQPSYNLARWNACDEIPGDCDANDMLDACEPDDDRDGRIDACDNCELFNPQQADCQGNGIGDACDIADNVSVDCNNNAVPDECDVASGFSADLNSNSIPDECELTCRDVRDCADLDRDSIRDDRCKWWACISGLCQGTPIVHADVGGPFGDCQVDHAADGHDLFHVLNCFANNDPDDPSNGYSCESAAPNALNVDPGGPRNGCQPDGYCDCYDAFAVLDAFAGDMTCSCPTGPHPESGDSMPPAMHIERATLRLVTSHRRARVGDVIQVDVHLQGPVQALRGYQLHVTAGRHELSDIFIEDRTDYVFGDVVEQWHAFNTATGQMLAGMDGAGIDIIDSAYLATFEYRIGAGPVIVEVLADPNDPAHRSFLIMSPPHHTLLISADQAVVSVESDDSTRRRRDDQKRN